MNGLSLLLYLTLFAQATAPLGSTNGLGSGLGSPPSTFNSNATSLGSGTNQLGTAISDPNKDDSRTYGWQINQYNELEYIVQISPSLLSFMQNPADKQELASQIPPALVGRVKRVVVRIGNEVLPRTPMDDIEKLFPAIASLPPGKITEMESGSFVNVNNAGGNGISGYPQSGSVGLNNSATAPLGSNFTDQARGMPTQTLPQGSLLDRFATSGTAISGQSNRFNNTAQNPNAQNPNVQNPNAQNPGYNRLADTRGSLGNAQGYVPDLTGQRSADPYALGSSGFGASGYGNNGQGTGALVNSGYASNPASNQYPQGAPYRNDAPGYNPNANSNTGLAGTGYGSSRLGTSATGYASDPIYNQGYNQTFNSGINGQYPNRQGYASTTGFGDTYGQSGNPLLDQRRVGNSYADQNGLMPASGYLASTNTAPRTDFPSTSINPQTSDRNLSQRPIAGQRSDLQTGAYPNYQATENNYFFYVFFILSIAVNLWMVHLLRSLYLRYRNLLSSLRSQATSLG